MNHSDNPVGPLRVVCVLDPAIDREATPVADYAETRDPSLVVELPGHRALWATLCPLSVSDFGTIESLPSPIARIVQSFRIACTSIENFGGPGIAIEPTKRLRLSDGRERTTWSDKEIERVTLRCGMQYVLELGGVAYDRAVQGNGWSGSVLFTLPLSSVHGLERIARQLAERAKRIDGTRSSERSASASTPPAPPSSAAGTVAPAESGPEPRAANG